ncbi:unnamed protein product, partial [Iphiclides podalirius]
MRQSLENWEGGIKINGINISNLRYADNTTHFVTSEAEMAELLKLLETNYVIDMIANLGIEFHRLMTSP